MRRVRLGWLGDESGSVAILAAAGIAVSVGVAAFAVDLSNAYAVKGRLQNAADAAALAAAQRLAAPQAARAAALELVRLNVRPGDGAVAAEADIEFGRWSSATGAFTAGLPPHDAVRVTTRRSAAAGNPVKTYFGGLLGASQLELEAQAVAVLAQHPCVIALDPAASRAFWTTGTADFAAHDCGIQVNSSASDALRADGSSSITASGICVGGGWRGRDVSPEPQPGCRLHPDPLKSLPEPEPPAGCYLKDATITGPLDLPAGVKLCGRIQLTGSARLWLNPGITYFEDAELHLAGQASIEASDAMLFFDRTSSFHLTSQGTVRLDPPREGLYRGIAIFQSRKGGVKRGKIVGGRELMIGGTLYAPRLDLEMAGHSALSGEIRVGYVIVNSFKLAGTAQAIVERGAVAPPSLTAGAVLVE